MNTVRALPVAGMAADIMMSPDLNYETGAPRLVTDRSGSGWGAAATLWINGQHGATHARLSMSPSQLRELAGKAERLATFLELRKAGEPAPCLCSAWSHNLYPCANDAIPTYSMCRECWPENGGQSVLTMGHGQP